jgi:transcriptional regulator with XRE-family HTH domain
MTKEIFKSTRQLKGYTQREFSTFFSVTPDSISRWERGVYPLPRGVDRILSTIQIKG